MRRFGQMIRLRPEKQDYYLHLHREAWPGVLELTRKYNIRNYSIFLDKGILFGYFEYIGTEYETDMEMLAKEPQIEKWWAECKPCQEPVTEPESGNWWLDLQEVFHMD